MKRFAALCCVSVLAGCAPNGFALFPDSSASMTPQKTLIVTCGSYTGVADVLADDIRLGLFDESEQNKIRIANEIITPICGNPEMTLDASAALALVEAQMRAMVIEQTKAAARKENRE